jgi:type I restriction enzyme M protein
MHPQNPKRQAMAKRKFGNSLAEVSGANLGFEAQLWAAANALRGSMDAGEYKHGPRWKHLLVS